MHKNHISAYQSQYLAWLLSRNAASNSIDSLATTLVDSKVDLNPHQLEAALFACQNPLSRGVILADEVGLGKTIEADLVISQKWAERKRKQLIIVPANLRKQWHQELQEKFGLQGTILESKNYNALAKDHKKPLEALLENAQGPIICSYPFAKSKAKDIKEVFWDAVILDEAHRLRNVYKSSNVIGNTLKDALAHVDSKILLTATPLQNSLLELYGLVSLIDDRVFGDLDSFRAQFALTNRESTFTQLRHRLLPLCKRTLRRDVQQYVPYTNRIAIVEEFFPTEQEREFSSMVADYLRRPDLKAMPNGQRQLISLVLWKLLASSPQAIAGALETMRQRLQNKVDDTLQPVNLMDSLDEDFEALDEMADEWSDTSTLDPEQQQERDAYLDEIAELKKFAQLAASIRDNAKGQALLKGLDKAFIELKRLGAARKAIIFTESKKTQTYLQELLSQTPYGEGLVLFNGTNSDASAQKIYKDWLNKHQGSDLITGSKTADTRAALVEYFREHDNPQGQIMIATEAGAEGINLQFCSLVINYDLPWNPQRIEQRIGRCHRYGQKHDVVVVNFIDKSNEADQRVYELLNIKFKLFDGVFGASDEVLGAIGSGVDFERRIADIYQNCRDPQEIKTSFEQLQLDLSQEINEKMMQTRQMLFEHFDEEVHQKIRVQAQNGAHTQNRYEQMLLEITRAELKTDQCAAFDDHGFELKQLPDATLASICPLGRYELPRLSNDAHSYRIAHPLAQWVIAQAKSRSLGETSTRLIFDYQAYPHKISTLEPYQGQNGTLIVKVLTVQALERMEQHLIVSAVTDDGQVLQDDDPERLLRIPAQEQPIQSLSHNELLDADVNQRSQNCLRDINQRNLGYFTQEIDKLDAWADDRKLGLEQHIKDIDRDIKETRKTAATAPTLDEKLTYQKQQRELEIRRNKLRRELFERQDEVEQERNRLIEQLESKLEQNVDEQILFCIKWQLV